MMSMFAERFKQSLDRRLPHFSTSVPYIVATILIMLVPLTVALSQQETSTRSQAQQQAKYTINVTVVDSKTGIAGVYVISTREFEGKACTTGTDGTCSFPVSLSGKHTIRATKGEISGEEDVNIAPDATSVPVTIKLGVGQPQDTSPSLGSEEYIINVVVKNRVTNKPLQGAFVSINDLDNCKTTQDGSCDLDIPSDAGPYTVYAIKGRYKPKSLTFPELSNGISITLKLTPDDTAASGPSQSSDESQNPNESSGPFQQNKRPNEQYDNSSDPNTGSPPNDSGNYPQTPRPEDFGCLGSCPTPTPNYCITPVPSQAESPDDTGTPSPTDGLYESIIERVQRQITETWNRVLSGLGGRNPNLKPPEFAN